MTRLLFVISAAVVFASAGATAENGGCFGTTIDFVDTIEKQGFTIDNPNATGSCACGDSFH